VNNTTYVPAPYPRWVFGFGGDIRILSPDDAVKKMLEMSQQMITAESEVKKM